MGRQGNLPSYEASDLQTAIITGYPPSSVTRLFEVYFRLAGILAERFELQNIDVTVRGNLNHSGSP